MSPPGDSSTQRRRNASQACINCRRRKKRCDGASPTCGTCRLYKDDCTWHDLPDFRKAFSRDEVYALRRRIADLEGKGRSQSPPSTTSPKRHQSTSRADRGRNEAHGLQPVNEPTPAVSTSDFVGIVPTSNQRQDLEGLLVVDDSGGLRVHGPSSAYRHISALSLSHFPAVSTSTIRREEHLAAPAFTRFLPEIFLTRQQHDIALDRFFRYFASWGERVTRHLFERDMEIGLGLADEANIPALAPNYSPMLHNIILALGLAYSDEVHLQAFTTRREYASASDQYFDRECARPTVATVQALALRSSFSSTIGDYSQGWVRFGSASRLCYSLGLHFDTTVLVESGKLSRETYNQRNATFWSYFIQEEMWAIYIGREPLCPPHSVPLPSIDEVNDQFLQSASTRGVLSQSSPSTLCFAHTARLMMLAQDITKIMYTGSSNKGSLVKSGIVHRFHDQLHHWLIGLPPSLALSRSSTAAAEPHLLMLHLAWSWIIMLLWQPLSQIAPESRLVGQEDPQDSTASTAMSNCHVAAMAVVHFATMYHQQHGLRFSPPTTAQILYTAGTSLLLAAAQAERQWQGEQSLRAADTCITFLEAISQTWQAAHQKATVLRDLLDDYGDIDSRTKASGISADVTTRGASPGLVDQGSDMRDAEPMVQGGVRQTLKDAFVFMGNADDMSKQARTWGDNRRNDFWDVTGESSANSMTWTSNEISDLFFQNLAANQTVSVGGEVDILELLHGHLLEFPTIRVDCFTPRPAATSTTIWSLPVPLLPHLPPRPAPHAQLFLLSHIHTDHLVGLSDSFTGRIVCSPDTKRMLLKLESESDRKYVHDGDVERPKVKYRGLQARMVDNGKGKQKLVDMIDAVPCNLPVDYEIGDESGKPLTVTVTLIDANHCPGSTMFLINSGHKAVLHTGDIRADRLFLQTIRRLPFLSEYFEPWRGISCPTDATRTKKRLDRIYLDNSAMLGTGDMPDKEEALAEMIRFMSLYPPDTVFFLDVWCFGWEDVVKEVARHFDAIVHVDRYKRSIFNAMRSDPFLEACTTTDPGITRFHACERRFKCEGCRTFDTETKTRLWNKDKLVVQIQMAEIKTSAWDMEREAFLRSLNDAAIGEGYWPTSINVPIARHSTLPELQALVSLFKPRGLTPNVLAAPGGIDYYMFASIFADSLDGEALAVLVKERDSFFDGRDSLPPPLSGLAASSVFPAGREISSSGVLVPSSGAAVSFHTDETAAHSSSTSGAGPIGSSRHAVAKDQIQRLVTQAMQGSTTMMTQTATTIDYDTDDEREEERKRKRRGRKRRMHPGLPSPSVKVLIESSGLDVSGSSNGQQDSLDWGNTEAVPTFVEDQKVKRSGSSPGKVPNSFPSSPMVSTEEPALLKDSKPTTKFESGEDAKPCLDHSLGAIHPAIDIKPILEQSPDDTKPFSENTGDSARKRQKPTVTRSRFAVDRAHLAALAGGRINGRG